jgi:hypothetical protein
MKIFKAAGKNGKARYGIRYTDPAGRDVRRVVASSLKSAEKIAAKTTVELEEGTYYDRKAEGKTALGKLVEEYRVHFAGKDSEDSEKAHLKAILSFWKESTLLSVSTCSGPTVII